MSRRWLLSLVALSLLLPAVPGSAAQQEMDNDDDDGSLFESDINRMAAAGITRGCGPREFCPRDVVDRSQMAAFSSRAPGLASAGSGDLFTDDDDSIFEHDIDRLAYAGITKGCNHPTNDQYCPNRSVDRGAMAAFLHRAIGDS